MLATPAPLAVHYRRTMLHTIPTVVGGVGSLFILAQVPSTSPAYLQYGAMGILAACGWYLVARIIPSAMHARQEETTSALVALTTEREKLVASMEKMAIMHSAEVKIARLETNKLVENLHNDAKEEYYRRILRPLFKQSLFA